MCVHASACPFGVWHLACGSPLCRDDVTATRPTVGKAVAWGTPPVLVLCGWGWGEQACAVCGLVRVPQVSVTVGWCHVLPVVFSARARMLMLSVCDLAH